MLTGKRAVRGRDRLRHARGGAEDGAALERARARDARSHSPSAAPLSREGPQAPPRFGCGRAIGDRGRIDRAVRPGGCRLASDIIGATRTPGLDGRFRCRSSVGRRARHSRRAVSARNAATRAGRHAPGRRHAAHERCLFVCALARRAAVSVCRQWRERLAALAAAARPSQGAAPRRNRGRHLSVLGAGWPRDRLFCRRQIEANRF